MVKSALRTLVGHLLITKKLLQCIIVVKETCAFSHEQHLFHFFQPDNFRGKIRLQQEYPAVGINNTCKLLVLLLLLMKKHTMLLFVTILSILNSEINEN